MISFIIPAYNEENLLGQTLTALEAAAAAVGRPYEVIVVDDASTDGTAAIARQHGVRVVPVEHRQIAATRNTGATAARGDMLVFIDADTVVTEGAVAAAVEAMRRGAAGGGCAFRFEGRLPFYGRQHAAVAVPLYRLLRLASGCFLFCTREAFRAAGGFDEGLFGAEEAALSRSLRRQGRFVILREWVTTSGRKLRTHSGREVLGLLVRLVLAGPKSVRRREGLEILVRGAAARFGVRPLIRLGSIHHPFRFSKGRSRRQAVCLLPHNPGLWRPAWGTVRPHLVGRGFRARLHLDHQKPGRDGHALRVKKTKTAKGRRRIDLSAETLAVLEEHREPMLAADFIGDPVFGDTQGGYLRNGNVRRDRFAPICRRAGLPACEPKKGKKSKKGKAAQPTDGKAIGRGEGFRL